MTNATRPAWGLLILLPVAAAAACSDGDEGISADPGDGSGTLLVRASIENDGDGAEMNVRVERAGEDLDTAEVVVGHADGDETLSLAGGGEYRGAHSGWSDSYSIEVTDGEDWLDGALAAPDLPEITGPDPASAFDPHEAEDGVVVLTWDGAPGMSVRVKTKDFEWEGEDGGRLEIPATAFEEEEQELEIARRSSVDLAGGEPGSELIVVAERKVTLIVTNPYRD